MRLPVQITFRNVEASGAVEAAIRSRAGKLDRYFDGIIGCRVVVEAPHQSRHKGNHYRVGIDLTVPGDELVVGRNPAKDGAREDVYVVIRDAFAAAERELKSYARRHRDTVRAAAAPPA